MLNQDLLFATTGKEIIQVVVLFAQLDYIDQNLNPINICRQSNIEREKSDRNKFDESQ